MKERFQRLFSGFRAGDIFRYLFKSLRIRIFSVIFLTGILSSVIILFATLSNYEERAVSVNTLEARTQMRILANHLIANNYLQDPSSQIISGELDMLSNLYDGRVLIIDDSLNVVRDTYGIAEGKTIISKEVVSCLKKGDAGAIASHDRQNGYIEMTTPIIETTSLEGGDTLRGQNSEKTEQVVRGVMLISISTEPITTTLEILRRKAMIIEIIILAVLFVFALAVADIMSRPFDRITTAIADVKAGYTNDPINENAYIETEHISNAFNQLLLREKALDDSRQAFVANVSHELKTPMTSIKVLADSLTAQPDASVELYMDFMSDITKEIDRENQIINDLLELVRMDKQVSALNISQVDINILTENIMKRLRPLARRSDVELTFESSRQITAEVDEVKMSMVITNLVENAIKYNVEHGWVRVTLDADHQYFTLVVEDSGVGIPEEAREHIYERFYRVDKSRSREIGGTGLGLAITRTAVLMHRGSIDLSGKEGEGTVFTVRIPLIHLTGKEVRT
ncbi:MAG: two-component sensor histidine kinase [Lachnospiraceae bacterium]|nr:two-component sensor histidine kinase [Lachnospiraceae bacterium]